MASTANDATFGFTYIAASQIKTRALDNDAYAFTATAGSKAYTANGLNQYTDISGASPLHDANGNLNNDGLSQTYSYDSENRLIAASGPRNATLGYDPMGRLAQVSDVATRRMAYDGDALAEEYDGSGNLLRRFVHGPGVDDPIVWYEGASLADRRFLHADQQGSVVAISDSTTITTINKYDEYGVPQSGFTGRFGYTGQAWVPEMELWYYKARFYGPDPKIGGRFLQVDPVGYEGGQINLLAYVGNDPMNGKDPSGNCPACGAVIGAIIDIGIQVGLEGKDLNEIDWVDVGISAGAGATGYGLGGTLNKLMKTEHAVARAERAAARAQHSLDRAKGATHRSRATRQLREARSAIKTAKETAKKVVTSAATVAAVKAGTKEATPPPPKSSLPPEDKTEDPVKKEAMPE